MGIYLIIGGSSGVGLATCSALLQEGHSVIASYNEHPIEITHPKLVTFYWNAIDGSLNKEIIPEMLDGFIYCPGLINLKPFHRMKLEDFMEDLRVQFLGAVQITQDVLLNLKASKAASVVFISTIAVQRGFPFHSLVGASKGALEGLMRSLAAEYAPSIRFNCIAPSILDTPLSSKILSTENKIKDLAEKHPLKRIGTSTDIANAATFLLTEKSSWITGEVIHIDGGKSKLF